MGALQKINHYRRNLMNALTRNIGSKSQPAGMLKNSVKQVLVSRPNHRLGNMLMVTPLVQEIENTFPGAKVDIFGKGFVATELFKNYSSVDRLLLLPKKHFKQLGNYLLMWTKLKTRRYDLVINVASSSSSGRLSTQFSNGRVKMFNDRDEALHNLYKDYGHMAKEPVYNLRKFLGTPAAKLAEIPIPTLNIKLSADELEKGRQQLLQITKNDKPTLAIYTFATGHKCYSPEWWHSFYNRLLKEFPNYNIVEILPVENVSQIDFKAPSFYSKDLRLIAAFIANTEMFIGGDSGMMHLASTSQKPVAGLFSVSNMDGYQPYGNHSRGINTNNTHLEEQMRIIREILSDAENAGQEFVKHA